jgi:hypothetical protein
MYGAWTVAETQYIEEVIRWQTEISHLVWAAPMDWMCEPWITAKTGLTVEDHQQRTVDSVLSLRAKAPYIHWAPVLQGWTPWDYERCRRLYERNGVNLEQEQIVGLGSVCRRQAMDQVSHILALLPNIKLHGFGFKIRGLQKYGQQLASADSLAWSFAGRRDRPLPGHTHKNCANCQEYALLWLDSLKAKVKEIE